MTAPERAVHKRVETSADWAVACDRGQVFHRLAWDDDWDQVTCPSCLASAAGRAPEHDPAWEREWEHFQSRAGAPKPPGLGCSRVTHDKLGFCAVCVGGTYGVALEVNGWRLLALRRVP